MTMKRLLLISATVFIMAVSAGVGLAAPKAVPVNPSFEFSDVAEGRSITHEFMIRNEGDTPLNILGVIPP
ncbi:MAG TPA: hypothetical protein DHV36_16905 [Desulfobacteraceae bacterium]|nr:hypothetical protein [Desulfobacteraceae bacterium]|tara:strand:- start:1523 stop:1732 length:210 start_codon:yes stop_codon:yes gene_type:complete